jgi:hypothetical protein
MNKFEALYTIELANKFGKSIAIQFAEFLQTEGYETYDGVGNWIAPHNNRNVYTTEQLYEQFNQTNNEHKPME